MKLPTEDEMQREVSGDHMQTMKRGIDFLSGFYLSAVKMFLRVLSREVT